MSEVGVESKLSPEGLDWTGTDSVDVISTPTAPGPGSNCKESRPYDPEQIRTPGQSTDSVEHKADSENVSAEGVVEDGGRTSEQEDIMSLPPTEEGNKIPPHRREILVPEQALCLVYQGNICYMAGYLRDAASMYKEALSAFSRRNNGCSFTTKFERDVVTGIVRCYCGMEDYDEVIRYADEVIKGQPRDSYDEYAQESLYYRGIAYEAKGDMKNAYRDVIELLPFNPRHPDLLNRSRWLKTINQACYGMPPSETAVRQNATKTGKAREKSSTGKQTPVSTTVEPTEHSSGTKMEAGASVKPQRKMKNYQTKKKRKKTKKQKRSAKGTTSTKPMAQPECMLPACSQEETVVQQEERMVESSSDSTDDGHQQESGAAASTNTLEIQKNASANLTEKAEERAEGSTRPVQYRETSYRTQKPVGKKDTYPVKMEVEPRRLYGSTPKRSGKQLTELQQKRGEKIQERVVQHQALEKEEREQKRKKIVKQGKIAAVEDTASPENGAEKKQVKKTSEVVIPCHEAMYEGIPGKAEPKYKRRQKGQYKAPTVVTLPIAIYNSMETSSSTHLPVVMAGGEQLVFTDPSVSSPTTATEERSEIASGKKHTKTTATEERSEIASGTKHTKKIRAEYKYMDAQFKETVNRIIHAVLRPQSGEKHIAQSRFDFSTAVLSLGKEVCSICFRDKMKSRIVEKDKTIRTCPFHRDTAWKPMLVWPARSRGELGSRFVPIRARPTNVLVHFVICRYGKHCYLADSCPYPHSKEELEAWTLDRDGKRWEFRQPKKLRLCENFRTWNRCPAADRCPYAHGEEELTEWRRRKELYRSRLQSQDAGSGDAHPLRRVVAEELHDVKKDRACTFQKVITFEHPDVEISCHPSNVAYLTSKHDDRYSQAFRFELKYNPDTGCSLRRATFVGNTPYFTFFLSPDYQAGKDQLEVVPTVGSSRSGSQVVEVKFTSHTERSFQQDVLFDFGYKPYVVQTLKVEIGSSKEMNFIKEFQEQMKGDSQHWIFDSENLCQDYVDRSKFGADASYVEFVLPEEQKLMPMVHRALDPDTPLSSDNYNPRFHTLLYVEEVARFTALSRVNRKGLVMKVRQDPEGTLGEIDLGDRPPSDSANSAFIRLEDTTVFELRILKTLGERVSLLLPLHFLTNEGIEIDSETTVDFQLAFDRTHFIHLHRAVDYISTRNVAERLIATSRSKRACNIDLRFGVPQVPDLNVEQMRAVERILCQRGTLPVIVNGPFGTGKTRLLAEAVPLIIRRTSPSRVLICTQSNHAADLYIEKMDDFIQQGAPFSLHRIYYRYYDPNRIYRPLYRIVLRYCDFQNNQFIMPDRETLLLTSRLVVITTLVTSMQLKRLDLPEGFFTHIIIDEAAQATEPETVAAVSLAGPKTVVVMAGDHKQINPPIYSPVARMGKLHYSLFRRLYKEISTVLDLKVDLVVNYRCHYDILNISSRLFYHTGNVEESNALGPQDRHPKFHPVSFYATSTTQSKQAGEDRSYYNPREAQAVVKQVERILADWPWEPYKENDLCVITTEKWQARYIRTLLRPCSKEVEVLTSAVVQGRQFRACVISTVLTQDGYRERNNTVDRDFLSNAKLLNTAITRAQSLVLVVGDPLCLCTCGKLTQLWLQYIAYCREKGGYYGLPYNDFHLGLGILTTKLNPESPAFIPSPTELESFICHSSNVDTNKVPEQRTKNTNSAWNIQRPPPVVSGDDSDDDIYMVEEYRRLVARKKIERDQLQLSVSSKATVIESGRGYKWQVIDSTVDDQVKYETAVKYEKHLRGEARFEAMKRDPSKFFRCRLSVINDDEAVAVVQNRPDLEIVIRGWKRRNRSFDGEEVLVKLDEPLTDGQEITQPLYGTVVGTFQEERPNEWVCVLSKREENLLLPLDKSFPRIINLPRSVDENGVAIFKRLSKTDRQRSIEPIDFVPVEDAVNKIFIVQFIKWRIDCMRPLGIVVEAREVGITIDAGMELLSRQYLPTGMVGDSLSREAENDAASLQISRAEYVSHGNVVENAFTIDSSQSTDLDDALSFLKDSGSDERRVGVYIADVAHFVRPGSPLDYYAFSMGTTYYDQEGVRRHNMLPDRLSSDLCSLLPAKDRLAIQILFTFDRDANLLTTNFKRCIVRSRNKLSYEEAEKIIDGDIPSTTDSALIGDIRGLYDLSVCVRRRRLHGNRWHLRNRENSGSPRSHSMVEEYMLLANKTVAEKLMEKCRPVTPLVVQGSPDLTKAEEWITTFGPYFEASCALHELAQNTSLKPQTPHHTTATAIAVSRRQWQDIQQAVATKKGSSLRQHLLLSLCTESLYPQLAIAHAGYHRCLQRASYVCADHHDDTIIGHNQLGFQFYTHFTSPIRRYVDIVVHRLLAFHVMGLKGENHTSYTEEKIQEICCHCSRTRALAQQFQRESDLLGIGCKAQSESLLMTAVVRSASSGRIELYLPDCPNLRGKQAEIRVSSLNPVKSAIGEEGNLTVTWSLRVVRHPLAGGRRMAAKRLPHENYFSIPIDVWKQLLLSVLSETTARSEISRIIRKAEDSAQIPHVLTNVEEDELVLCDTEEDEPASNAEETASVHVTGITDNTGRLDGTNMPPSNPFREEITGMMNIGHTPSSGSGVIVDPPDDEGQAFKFSDSSADEEDAQLSEEVPRKQRRHKRKGTQSEGDEVLGSYQHVDATTLLSQEYRTGSLLSVQLSARLSRGLLRPFVQLIRFPGKSALSVCIEHYNKPVECFVDSLPYNHSASKDSYDDVLDYQKAWLPVIDFEAATSGVKNSSRVVLVSSTIVRWTRPKEGYHSVGHMEITLPFIKENKIGCNVGDFICLRYTDIAISKDSLTAEKRVTCLKMGNLESMVEPCETSQWVSHCRIVQRIDEDRKNDENDDTPERPLRVYLTLENTGERQHLPDILFSRSRKPVTVACTAQFIPQTLPFMRMKKALSMQNHSRVASMLCLGEFSGVTFGSQYDGNTSEEERKALSVPSLLSHSRRPLNRNQFIAVKLAMTQDITLIQGPPGTGKTITGAHIVIQFLLQQKKVRDCASLRKCQVMYCCPSNQTVDDVTERLKRALSSEKILRVYGELIEKKRFPGLSIFEKFASPTTKHMTVDSRHHKDVALHYRIRDSKWSEYATAIRKKEQMFRRMKASRQLPTDKEASRQLPTDKEASRQLPTDKEVKAYEDLVKKAEQEQIHEADIVLCTCIQAGSGRMNQNPMALCIVDEAGQSLEPETLVAISKAKRVVLIGDHKQLRPVVQNARVQNQLSRSMFERLAESRRVKKEHRMHMLTVQYRMHKDICLFPSDHFYSGKLETATEVQTRPPKGNDFWNRLYGGRSSSHLERRKCFVRVEGEEQTNPVATEGKGGEESKYNPEEANIVVQIVKTMVKYKCQPSEIRVITPYTAQKAHIEGLLHSSHLDDIEVSSVFASQGGEADFIVLSTVRSLAKRDLVEKPSRKWMRNQLGFIADEHQMNVALTRAKHGLVIVGNSNLLSLHSMWKNLLAHYKEDDCFIEDWSRWSSN